MVCKAIPYEGNEPYIFLSYCHKDAAQVYPIFEKLAAKHYRVWYDEGNHGGDDWSENIAQHLSDCSVFLAFVSRNSDVSHSCKAEMNFADQCEKRVIPILLESFPMTLGTKLLLSARHYLKRLDFPNDDALLEKVCHSDGMSACLGSSESNVLRNVVDSIVPVTPAIKEETDNKGEGKGNGNQIEIIRAELDPSGGSKSDDNKSGSGSEQIHMPDNLSDLDGNGENNNDIPDPYIDDPNDKTILGGVLVIDPKAGHDAEDDDEKTQRDRKEDRAILLQLSSLTAHWADGHQTVIGRSEARCHIVIKKPTISKTHTQINCSNDRYYLRDAGSSNGTYYQNTELVGEANAELKPVDIFRVHDEYMVFLSGNVVRQAVATGRVGILTTEDRTEAAAVVLNPLLLNRSMNWPSNIAKDKRVHRHVQGRGHAKIEMHPDGAYLIEDGPERIEESNGTFLNGQRLGLKEARPLKNGDKIRIGQTILEFTMFELQGELSR